MSLKNCPFCGGEASIDRWDQPDLWGQPTGILRYVIECDNACGIQACTSSSESLSEVTAAWNTRAAPTMKPWEWVEAELVWGFWSGKFPRGNSVMHEISEDYGSWVRDELFFRVKPEPEKVQLCTLCGSIDGNSSRHTHPASCPGKVYLFYVDDAISVT